jgi:uncharacterized protein YbjT (DUF2867 family)
MMEKATDRRHAVDRREETQPSEILVTGGTGSLGSRVVDRLRDAGGGVRPMSRSGRDGTIRADLLSGEGLEEALVGVDAVVHCASSPLRRTRQTDVEGTDRLLRAAERTSVSHFVYVSIVGVDSNPYYPYYRVKLEVERLVERSGVPWTILRATQFHEFVLKQIRFLERGPLALAPKGFLFQPIETGEVADLLAELALSAPAGRVPDVGGPEVRTAVDLTRSYLRATGRQKRVLELPIPGRMARALRQGAQVAPDHRYGRTTWEEFLGRTLHPSDTGRTARKVSA